MVNKKRKLILKLALIIFILFLILSTKLLLNKYKNKEQEINSMDIALETVFLLPNNGSIEVVVNDIPANSASKVKVNKVPKNNTSPKDTKNYTADNTQIKTTNQTQSLSAFPKENPEIKPEAPEVKDEEIFKIPETGTYLEGATQKGLFKGASILLFLGFLIRFFVKTII